MINQAVDLFVYNCDVSSVYSSIGYMILIVANVSVATIEQINTIKSVHYIIAVMSLKRLDRPAVVGFDCSPLIGHCCLEAGFSKFHFVNWYEEMKQEEATSDTCV